MTADSLAVTAGHPFWHVKTGSSIIGPTDWSLPHDEGCPGCLIEELLAKNAALVERLEQAGPRADRYEAALERIAAGKRPDGTYNLSREACEQIARAALASIPKEEPHG